MRTITHSDVLVAARRLLCLPRSAWAGTLDGALWQAHAADGYRKRTGLWHHLWGDGSLGAAIRAGGDLAREPFPSDPAYLEALGEVIHSILEWRCRQNIKTS